LAAIDGCRIRAAAAGRSVKRVITSYEAGWCGFWLAKWLMAHGVEVHVVQSSSVPVDRRMRLGKSDGIDAELLCVGRLTSAPQELTTLSTMCFKTAPQNTDARKRSIWPIVRQWGAIVNPGPI
jgi:transposase